MSSRFLRMIGFLRRALEKSIIGRINVIMEVFGIVEDNAFQSTDKLLAEN